MAINSFGDNTDNNKDKKRFSRAAQKKLAGNVNTMSRQQASAGSLGTTLGDNSGTGVNTPTAASQSSRGPVVAVGTPGGERLGARFNNDPNRQAAKFEERMRQEVNGGRISQRAASELVNSRFETLAKVGADDRATEARSQIADADRRSTLARTDADRLASAQSDQLKEAGSTQRSQLQNATQLATNAATVGAQDRRTQAQVEVDNAKLGQLQSQFETSNSINAENTAYDRSAAIGAAKLDQAEQARKMQLDTLTIKGQYGLGDIPSETDLDSYNSQLDALLNPGGAAREQEAMLKQQQADEAFRTQDNEAARKVRLVGINLALKGNISPEEKARLLAERERLGGS